jgi:hypothetical protein
MQRAGVGYALSLCVHVALDPISINAQVHHPWKQQNDLTTATHSTAQDSTGGYPAI